MSQAFYYDYDPFLRVDASVLFGMLESINVMTGKPYAKIEFIRSVPSTEAFILRKPFLQYRIHLLETGDYVWADVAVNDYRLLRLETWEGNRANFILNLIEKRFNVTSLYEQSLEAWNSPDFQDECPELFDPDRISAGSF